MYGLVGNEAPLITDGGGGCWLSNSKWVFVSNSTFQVADGFEPHSE